MTDSTRERLDQYMKQDPTQSTTELAKKLGVSRKRAFELLKLMGYRIEWRKVK